jgi:hypothetical protein
MNEPKQELMTPAAPDPLIQFDQTLMALAKSKTDVATIREMMAMRKEYSDEEARKAFARAMTAFRAEPIVVLKSRQVGYTNSDGDFVGYTHAELADFTEAIGPAMAKHGLSYNWRSRKEGAQVYVTCVITHADGHSQETPLDAPLDTSGKKNAIQSLGSTITYLQRYTLCLATGVAARGIDDDGRSGGEGDGGGEPDPQQDLIDSIAAKIGLSERLEELQPLKSQITSVTNVEAQRQLKGAYNSKLRKLRGVDDVQPGESAE